MDSQNCWLKNNCKQLHCSDPNGCMILYKLDYLYNEANIPVNLRYNTKLVVDADGTDLNEFKTLKNIQDDILTFVATGKQLLIHSQTCGNGKAQPDESLILTLDGYKKMVDINIRDKIFGEDGNLHQVVGKYDRGIKDIYKITFTDGCSTESCDEHLWNISDRTSPDRSFKTIELKELIGKNLRRYKQHGWRYQVPITRPLNFIEQNLTIDPYLLGYILGDGHTSFNEPICLTIAPMDAEDIIPKINAILPSGYYVKKQGTRYGHIITNSDCKFGRKPKGDQAVNIIKSELKNLGIIDNLSYQKYIPEKYLYSSAKSRLALLQGLMDTDGTCIPNTNNLSFGTTSKKLAEQVVFLAQSLGGTAKISIRANRTYKYKKLDGDTMAKPCRDFYNIQIKLPTDIIPFRLTRKINSYANKQQNEPYRAIHDITYIGKKHCYCIMTDNPTHLYLTDNCIVTHNTSWSLRLLQTYFNKIWLKTDLSCKALFINVPYFLLALKDNISNKNAYIQHIKENVLSCDLVVWDDIGSKNSTIFESENLLSMIDGRIINNKANIFTSNLSDAELHQALGDRLASRICNLGYNIVFKGGDKRGI